MYKVLSASSDAYITNRLIEQTRVVSASVGQAGTLDLFKLYGNTYTGDTPNSELSRILIKFDLGELSNLHNSKKININNSSFNATLRLYDVYGGQPTPENFIISVYPLSRSFDEGRGRDVVFYQDIDACNWLSSSFGQGEWVQHGCSSGGSSTSNVDYITSIGAINTLAQQTLVKGTEDLNVDVTTLVSATLSGLLPDNGFRISFDSSYEGNTRSYFVKRFASRHAYATDKHPQLIIKYDDSLFDDTLGMTYDVTGSMFAYSFDATGQPAFFLSGSTELKGTNCVLLKLTTQASGTYDLYYTGSIYNNGAADVTGVYKASVVISETQRLKEKFAASGSVDFTPYWTTLDGSIALHTGEKFTINPRRFTTQRARPQKYIVNVVNAVDEYARGDIPQLRVNIFDESFTYASIRRGPLKKLTSISRSAQFSVRNVSTGDIAIPFDDTYGSTKMSSDVDGLFFFLDTSALHAGNRYVIDVKFKLGGTEFIHRDASSIFRVR